jgi:Zn-dependent peptidase ImmA (M78 family)/transcriptional regulator with XRE-family HTH domain
MFTPSRLALARRRRGITKRRLAEAVGLTARSITAFEAGDLSPGEPTLARLADALAFPIGFFQAPDLDEVPEAAASFRALSKISAAQRHAALAAGSLALGLHEWMAERFKLPSADVPKIGPGVDPETAAEAVRSEWGLGELPIANLIHLLEARGVRVFSLADESREVDAFSLWQNGTPFVFLNVQKSAEHSRMDAAHELGHLVLHWHHDLPQGREAEREAQAFASAFLMPRAGVLATAPRSSDLETLIQYKLRWRVSLAALVYRMHALRLLSDWNYRSLYAELSGRGFRTAEPRPIARETSQVLSKVFAALRKEGIGKSDVADALQITSADLDALVFGLAILPLSNSTLVRRESATAGVRRPQRGESQPLRVFPGGGT